MAKAAKEASTSGSKSITDYFSRKAATQSKSDNLDGQNKISKRQQKAATTPFTSSSPARPMSMGLSPDDQFRLRSRTPEANGRVESPTRLSNVSPVKRSGKSKVKLGVDTVTGVEKSRHTVCKAGSIPLKNKCIATPSDIQVPLTPLSPKDNSLKINKSRKRDPPFSPESTSIDEVPGSVSGEEEMECVPRVRRNAGVSKETVAKWRTEASKSMFDMPEDMDVDENSTSKCDTELSLLGVTPPPSRQPTPPPTTATDHRTVLPPPPTPIDTAKKTENLIAEIKARALAAAKSSQVEEEARIFKETLSDSDSDDDLRPIEINVKGKGKAKEVAVPVKEIPSYYNTRGTDAQLKNKAVYPTVLQPERRKAATKKHNPFFALLKEKREEERNGRSDADFLKAAESILPKSKMLLDLDDDEDVSFGSPSQKTAAFLEKETHEMNADFGDVDRRRLFGDQSEGIKNILDGDRKIIKADEHRKNEAGVQFWRDDATPADDDVDMDVEPTLDFGDYTRFPVLCKLHDALESDDQFRAITVLDAGLLNTVTLEGFPGVTSYLTYLALSPTNVDLSSSAFKALRNVWIMSRGSGSGITLRSVLSAISRLGAKSESLNLAGRRPPNLDAQRRESLIFRLVKLIESSARPRLLHMKEIPELVLVLLAISLDPSTSAALQSAIAVALDALLQSIADPNVVADIEPIICTKILSYIQKFEPCNISRILIFLTGSAGRSTRIARWVARSVLLGKTRVTESEYCHTPPVQDLSATLVEEATTPCQAFQIKRATDYVELRHYVQILAVALTDIPSYYPSEITATAAIKAEHSVHGSPSKDKPETPLEHMNRCITFVQRKITDNGTDIERSRTKAALQQLSMRLYFQLAARKSDKNPAISTYFAKRKSTARRR
ncbi:hypothetical protein GGU10DRAFT_383024 [Lentinula aff. detonsa]|uniref:Uncharacterized protein n=1 Tax=Lentinula aff. detonsa TaxID=2804958 RepID=A0AA38NTI5_9AGAR|nr:hypothetical protein GGU10DRAFT_383024 [Lentinula aff. detonsa]